MPPKAKLGSFDDYKAPWEVEGEDVDPDKIKKHYYNLLKDLERKDDQIEIVTGERDGLKSKVDEFETKDLSEVERLKRENEQLKSKTPEGDDLENARLRLALRHGLTEKQANRLQGSTAEELEADVPDLLEEIGTAKKDKSEETDPPAGRFRTGNDHGNQSEDYNPDKYVDTFA